jgi:hypothetical protein
MHINDYFKHQQSYHLSEQKKSEIFSRIKQKRREQSVTWRSFSYKKVGYSLIATALIVFAFGGIRIDKYYGITNPNIHNVHAGYIAEILDSNGEYTIKNGSQTISSLYLNNNDIVYLNPDSEILFTLNDDSQATLVGPAEFFLTKSETGNYTIHLLK